ncbi:hypothetical protein K440DRAFT_306840 [Wilcoxina mikolae CBS 423.85]|nr:hypothetical protein K440DRAFT_306840 [Wilcoxina mikolae CBS 423.85]
MADFGGLLLYCDRHEYKSTSLTLLPKLHSPSDASPPAGLTCQTILTHQRASRRSTRSCRSYIKRHPPPAAGGCVVGRTNVIFSLCFPFEPCPSCETA